MFLLNKNKGVITPLFFCQMNYNNHLDDKNAYNYKKYN
ncbi:hypothetical protein H477_5023 [[Clostridium] sordellii ATCC 9714]|nr:hypothetical protein H477_5023 [[Clostridium] sordellii ATCC 9714] [Paeniclostridium sordellii ATCC 9714]